MTRSHLATRSAGALTAILAATTILLTAPVTTAAPGDIGFEGPIYTSAGSAPSGSKPESKLWYNDGIWWADMWSQSAAAFHIWRLDLAGQQWVDTGVALDNRTGTRADALWDGTKLYVVSHRYSTSPAAGYAVRLYRFSYNSTTKAYSLDSGYPAQIHDFKTETLVFDKDSTGTLWATWVQNNQVFVSHSNGADNVWVTPYVLPATGTTVDPDDISSVIAFRHTGDPARIGVMWSNQLDDKVHFAFHDDGAADNVWDDSKTAIQGPGQADDHINLKSLGADGSGRIYAAIKTSLTSGASPLIMLLTFTPATMSWSSVPVARVSDGHTRPIVVIDQEHQTARVYMTGPVPPATNGDSGGAIYEKTSPLSNLSFATGLGTPVIQDADSPFMNNVTSTKQNVTSTTGLVLLAGNDTTDHYWWTFNALGGSPPANDPPVASFTATPSSGPAPLNVSFTDSSTKLPTSWAWDFENDGTIDSTDQNPSHTYPTAGTFTAKLTATNAGGSSSTTRSISVSAPLGFQTFSSVADSFTSQASPTKNYGSDANLRVRSSTSSFKSYVKFNVTGLSGTVKSVKLRLFVNDASPDGGSVSPTATTWTETGTGSITWNNAPGPLGGSTPKAIGPTSALGTWTEVELGPNAVTANGTYSFVIASASSNSAYYSSRNGTNAPQLVIGTDGGGGTAAPVASFTGTPTSGTAPLDVQFTDTSTNTPTSWAWDFDNDGTVDSTAPNPKATYSTPGTYSVKLTATNAGGSNSATKASYITVGSAPAAPVAAFSGTPVSGNAPLQVQFTDASTNGPTSWAWDFDNDGTTDSTAQNPKPTYSTPGTYSVKLTATNTTGSDSVVKTNYITVGSAPPPPSSVTFTSTADTRVASASPTSKTGGTDVQIRVRNDPTGSYHMYIRFNVTGLSGTVTSAKLRLWCVDGSPDSGRIYPTSGAWDEATTSWSNAPAATGAAATAPQTVTTGAWAEFDVTSLVTGNGQIDLLGADGSSNSAYYSSREGVNAPQLVVTTTP